MAWISLRFKSEMLNMPVNAEVLVPQIMDRTTSFAGDYKVIVLMHGANWDRCEWLLKSNIFDLVREKPVLVFMPSGKNSFYINTANGYRYMDFITKEIPSYIKKHFNVSTKREDWLIAGESMGGYGAVVGGLNAPEQFGNIATFSGALDILSDKINLPSINKEHLIGADILAARGSNVDVYSLCHKVNVDNRPRIYMNCGKQDSLYDMNVAFYNEIKDEYDVTCNLETDGGHNFGYWNAELPKMLDWFIGEVAR